MNKLFGLLFLVLFFACKGENSPQVTSSENTKSLEDTSSTPESLTTTSFDSIIEEGDANTSTEPEKINNSTIKPEKEPVYVSPKPRPIETQNTQENKVKEMESSSQNNETQPTTSGEKPENPPVYVSPEPNPNKVDQNKEMESSDQNSDIHASFNELLKTYVSRNGKVNYNQLKANDLDKLETYLTVLKNNPPQATWSKDKQLAFWINAYNAFTIKKILDNYPLKSITDLDGGKPWDVKWIKIGNKTYSLNNIENDIIRPQFNDARIHFAVNCAAKSCPPLLNQAYTAANLNKLLNSQTQRFINNKNYNDLSGDVLKVSKIFDWYKKDFNGVASFINKYAETKVSSNARIDYQEYNWALNN